MSQIVALLKDRDFWLLCHRVDQDLARQEQAKDCEHCAGRLDQANYQRKPRGGPEGLAPGVLSTRFSLCCAVEGCRRRRQPASVRFLDGRVFVGAMVVLASTLSGADTKGQRRELEQVLGVSLRTVKRWRRWWREVFVQTAVWRRVQGLLMPPVETARLPASLLERFAGEVREQLEGLLHLLLPQRAGATGAERAG